MPEDVIKIGAMGRFETRAEFATREEAVRAARDLALHGGIEVHVHDGHTELPLTPPGTESGLDELDPSTTEARDATHLRRIAAAAKRLEQAEADLHSAVDAARADGESWAVVGAALGVTRQGAYQRFGR